jgi:hypothetical protein
MMIRRHPRLPPDYLRQSPVSPQLNAGNTEQGLRSLRDLTQHLTTRADDNHAAPVSLSPQGKSTFTDCQGMSSPGKVLRVASN